MKGCQNGPLEQISRREFSAENHAQNETSARQQLDTYLERLSQHLPAWLSKLINWLREPNRILARAIISILLIAGGILSFLPVLGLWMLPLGLIVISQDLPFLQRPTVRALKWSEGRWQALRDHFNRIRHRIR
jgi:hypothetical protein